MPRVLLFALLILVAAPLALLGWVSAASMRRQGEIADAQVRSLLRSRLSEIDTSLASVIDGHARRLSTQIAGQADVTDALYQLELHDPTVRQGIMVSGSGILVYPQAPVADDPDDIALYAALTGMIAGRTDFGESGDGNVSLPESPRRTANRTPRVLPTGSPHWQVWYMDEGSQLILWIGRSDGSSIGILLERVRWLADMTAVLPDSNIASGDAEIAAGFTALVDEARQIVYRWGDEGECSETPMATIPLSSPLSSWRLEFHSDAPIVSPVQSTALVASLAGVGVVLLALGGFVLTSVQRQMRSARNRVSFAGQVSHELRTPLTNIRLYAELAESDLEDVPPGAARQRLVHRLSVIDSESRRLSRLVSGVLEMIREDRKQRGPRVNAIVPDEVINQTIDQFAPSFQKAGLRVRREAGADFETRLDADILETVLVNLLSNVEKYACGGGEVDVQSSLDDQRLLVVVHDCGPGIPRHKHRSVFRPFTRLDDSINAPSGTGIGLTIARSAARRHGGELRLVPSSKGTRFELVLPVKP